MKKTPSKELRPARNKNKNGFIQLVLLAIVIIAALAYFNIDLRAIADNLLKTPVPVKIWAILKGAWVNYLAPLGIYLWGSIKGLLAT